MEVDVFKLSDSARSFATRSKGQELARKFREVFEAATADTIVVAWDDIKAASPSFIDEFVGGIREVTGETPMQRTVVFSGDDPYVIELVDTILRRRQFPVRFALRSDDVAYGTWGMLGHPTIPSQIPV